MMGSKNVRSVEPDGSGAWKIKAPNAKRASGRFPTQGAAEKRAKQIVRRAGGGEVRIHDERGRIRNSDTVPPGNDPRSVRDRKH